MNERLRGAVAGLAGTAVMTSAMAVAKATGLMAGEWPPRNVARHFEEAIGVRDALPRPAFEVSWVGQHSAYGAAAGVAYARSRRRLRLPEPLPTGPLFGAALWAFGYAGWLPATGLYPPPTAEPRRRIGTPIAAHLIDGTATATVSRRLGQRDEAADGRHRVRDPDYARA
jgi:hypothetical protein